MRGKSDKHYGCSQSDHSGSDSQPGLRESCSVEPCWLGVKVRLGVDKGIDKRDGWQIQIREGNGRTAI